MTHDHNCFRAAEQRAQDLEAETGQRCGHFLYVGSADVGDAHYLGNTAFAGGVFTRLVKDVVAGHEFGKCAHCDNVATALLAARSVFVQLMSGSTGRC